MSKGLAFWLAADVLPTLSALRSHPEAIQELARRRLSRLLFHVARNNPFYGQRLRSAGIEWADPVLQQDPYGVLAALQPVSKLELRRAGTDVFDEGELKPDWYSSASSGSTGEPFRMCYEPRAWARLQYLIKLRARIACGVDPENRVAVLDRIKPVPVSPRLRARRWTRISVLQPAPAIAAALKTFAPDVLYGPPSALLDAGRILQQEGFRLQVRMVFTSGELLQPMIRENLSRVFGARVYDVYGTSETKEIAWQCPDGEMHVNADVVHLETVDEAGHTLPPNREGELVATLLVNRAMPLLRYRTGDRGVLRPGRCTCGSPLPLGVVTGRTADILIMRDGQSTGPRARFRGIEPLAPSMPSAASNP